MQDINTRTSSVHYCDFYDVPNVGPEELKKEQDLIKECRDAKIDSRSVGFRRISYLVKEMTGKDLSQEKVTKLSRLEKERGKLFNEAEANTVVIVGVEKAVNRIKLIDRGPGKGD
jgi:Zn-finger protein